MEPNLLPHNLPQRSGGPYRVVRWATGTVAVQRITISGVRAGETVPTYRATLEPPRIAEAITVHHGHTPEVDLRSPTSAYAIWAMEDPLIWPNGTRVHGFGHYHETYEKVDGDWLIKSQKLTRLHLDHSPATES